MDVTIIHLSDLHLKNDAENRFRLNVLREDISKLQAKGPVFTAFTGDLVQAGGDGAYELLFDELIGPLAAMGHEIFVVPGNHDVDRSVASESFCDSMLKDRGSSYLYDGKAFRLDHPDTRFDALKSYSNLQSLLGPYDRESYWGYAATKGAVTFVGLNSAWLCCGREANKSERGLLRIEPAVLEDLISKLPSDTLRVALLHHPIDWLEETTRSAVHDLLVQNFDLVLFGHVHASDAAGLVKGPSNCLFHQVPPLRADWSKGTNGYAVIRSNAEHKRFQIEYRSYSKPRREFVVGEDFAPNGICHPRPEDIEYFNNLPSVSGLLQRFIGAAPFDFLDWYRNNVRAKSKLTGSFIVPKAKAVSLGEDGVWYGPSQRITDILDQSSRNQYFVAPLDAGSTTSAFIAFRHLAEQFDAQKRIPTYFDAQSEKINKASLLREMNRTCLVKFTHSETQQLSDSGSIVMIVDGLCLGDVGQFNLFRETAERHFPQVRFIYFLSTERRGVTTTEESDIKLSPSTDEVFELAQLEVADIRSMIEARLPDLALDPREGMVSHVVESFRQMDEPIFASSGAVVIDTLVQDPEFKPLNKARLIERYVECLLGRFDLEDVREGIFNSSDKISLLSVFARDLLNRAVTGVSDADWKDFAKKYQDDYLLELPGGLLDEFIEKGLLTRDGGKITFRGDHLFSFFVARQMKSDQKFAGQLIDSDGLFKHYREVTVYGELEGTAVGDVLDSMYALLSEIETQLLEDYFREGIDLTTEWEMTCADGDTEGNEAALSAATTELNGRAPTTEDADRIDNAELANVSRRRGIAMRSTVREAEARLLVGMRLYSLLLKNALHIEAKDKLRHLEKLFDTAELWVGFMCSCREAITHYPIVIAGGVRFINFDVLVDPQKAARDFKYTAPSTVSKLLVASLRNPQMGAAIRKVLPKLEPMSALFARDALLEMPDANNRKAYIDSLMAVGDKSLLTCSLRTLRSKYLAAGRKREQRQFLEAIVDEIAKDKRIAGKTDFAKMRKARILQDLRDQAHKTGE